MHVRRDLARGNTLEMEYSNRRRTSPFFHYMIRVEHYEVVAVVGLNSYIFAYKGAHAFAWGPHQFRSSDFYSSTMMYSATFTLALLLTEAARALPQLGNAFIGPASLTGPGSMYPSSQPSYTSTSSCTSTKEPYPPTTTMHYPSVPPSQPSSNCGTPPKAPSTTLRATYDTTYDDKDGSLNNVACSNGANGLAGRFTKFGDIPSFPFIGGAFDVVWNSPNCGACWSLTNTATGVSINITAIDTAGSGFNIAQEAFVELNGGQVGQGVLDVVATKVSPSVCGL